MKKFSIKTKFVFEGEFIVSAEIYGEDVVLPISYAIGSAIDAADWADLTNKEI